MDQTDPFHCSTSDVFAVPPPVFPSPTATQKMALTQSTPVRSAKVEDAGLGLGTADHDVPFHCSTSVPSFGRFPRPTAVHELALRQLTSRSSPVPFPGGLGVGTRDQDVPFHSSARVSEASFVAPVAIQKEGPTHETPER
jgi:hypothetical protein